MTTHLESQLPHDPHVASLKVVLLLLDLHKYACVAALCVSARQHQD